jgi:hypothetical protein
LIVFDLDDTLYLERDFAFSGYAALDPYVHEITGRGGFGATCRAAFMAGRRQRIFDEALSALGVPPTPAVVADLVDRYREHDPDIELCADARRCLDRLSGRLPLGLITDGPEVTQRAKIAALGIDDAVSLPGLTARPGAWIEAGDIMVLSSRYEGFPNVVAEATVSGLPVVSFDCPYGPRELIADGENGLLVPEGNVDALAEAISRLANDPELRRKMRAGALLNRARLSETAVMRLWDRVIETTPRQPDLIAARVA